MEELKAKIGRICNLKDQFLTVAESEMAKGAECVNTHEMGEVVDMIKDLCEAEEKLYKACYYKSIVEAMDEEEEKQELMMKMGMGGEGRMGYDNWRYDSGRFAPKGHGHRSGYRPGEEVDETWMMAEGFGDNPWETMGYNSGRSGGGSMGRGSQSGMGSNGRMGYTGSDRGHKYDRYRQARMGYHESKDATHKEHMDASAREYVVDIAESVKEMWKEADPAMKKEIKNKFVALTSEMN